MQFNRAKAVSPKKAVVSLRYLKHSSMKKISLILLCISFLINAPALLAQSKKEQEQAEFNAAMKLMNVTKLMYQGKANEAILIMVKITDSLRTSKGDNPKANEQYMTTLGLEANFYQSTGNFAKAEQVLIELLEQFKNRKEPEKKARYKDYLKQLANIYEKMGRNDETGDSDEKNERVLEELVIAQYANFKSAKSEKEEFYAFYSKTYLSGGSLPATDSVELMQKLEPYFNGKTQLAEPGSETYAFLMMIQGFRAINQAAHAREAENSPKAPIEDYIKLLKTGKFAFGQSIGGISFADKWEETRRLAALYIKTGNYVAAEALLKQAIANDDANQSIGNPMADYSLNAIITSMNYIGNQNDMKQVMESTKSMMEANSKHNGTDINYIKNKVLLAQLYHDTGRMDAYQLLTDTIASLCKKMEDVTNEPALNAVAASYTAIGRFKEAAGMYQKLADGWKSHGYKGLVPFQLITFKELAKADRLLSDDAGAEAALKQAVALYKQSSWESYPDYRDLVIDLAKLYENTGRFALAEQTCGDVLGTYFNNITDNFSFLSEREKLSWLTSQISVLDFSASLLRTNSNPSAGFVKQIYNQQLLLKGLVLTDQEKVFNAIRKNGTPQVKQLFAQWQSNKAAIAWQYTQPATGKVIRLIDSLSAVANNQEKEINQLSGALNQLSQNKQISFKQIQQKLAPGQTAIEFVRFNYYRKTWTDSVWYGAFIIRAEDPEPHFVPLFEERQLAQLLSTDIASREFVDGFYGNTTSAANAGSSNLYSLIFKPLQPFLKEVDNIAIAPAGLLNNISFKALPANGGYLIDSYKDIRLYSSIREIAEQKQANNSTISTAVLYGGIRYGTADSTIPENEKTKYTGKVWSSLNTLPEVSQIDTMFNANKISSTAIISNTATEESLKQLSGKSPGILHIATHGFSVSAPEKGKSGTLVQRGTQFTMADNPMFRNGIIMANGNKVWSGGLPAEGKDDGILTAYEIANLDLSNTSLVTLSACETALGDIKGTEGTFGLQRAFKLAGVKNMLLSLWDLPDAETVEFMKAFYTGKIVKKLPDYQALKAVQDEFRKTKPPYFWAGFILIE